jgi:hypothetical protein
MRLSRYLNDWAAHLIKLWQDLPIKPSPPTPPPLIEIEKNSNVNFRLLLMTRRAEILKNTKNTESLKNSNRKIP